MAARIIAWSGFGQQLGRGGKDSGRDSGMNSPGQGRISYAEGADRGAR